MEWITLQDLLLIHAHAVRRTGGMPGLHNPAALSSALLRPFRSFGGQELFPSLLEKVAATIHSLVQFHPFLDANTPTALVAGDVCLRLNGRRLSPSADVEAYFWSIARGEQSVEQIAGWLGSHTEPWGDS